MPEYVKPATAQEFDANFEQLKPLMSPTQAFYESARCLFCYDAPCVKACPTGIDIPLFIRQIHDENEAGAAKTIYDANYFGYACGKVCPTEVLCEGACVYNHQGVKPIEIGRLQSYAAQEVIRQHRTLYKLPPLNGHRVAIIGAGPAGISCACELRLAGIHCDIYEAGPLPSGLTIHGVAPYKITNGEVMAEMRYLQAQFGFRVMYNMPVSNHIHIKSLEKDYDAIFLGIGLGPTTQISLPGEHLQGVFGAVEFIRQLRAKKETIKIPDRVIVLGGGNTAMDAASESSRMGASDVILAYRRSKTAMGAYEFEYELAKRTGVTGLFNVVPVSINGEKTVTGVTFVKTIETDGKLVQVAGSEFTIDCDWVIKATGQSKQTDLLLMIGGLHYDNRGRITVSEDFQTSKPQYFAGGDAVSGGEEVVNAAAAGKKAAAGIIKYIQKNKT